MVLQDSCEDWGRTQRKIERETGLQRVFEVVQLVERAGVASVERLVGKQPVDNAQRAAALVVRRDTSGSM